MSILVNKNSKVIVQGITGGEGAFHSQQMIDYGSNIVAGVTPGKGGSFVLEQNIPVFNSVEEAQSNTNANVSIIFVPPAFASEAIIEASEANIKLIVCITEGVPINDMAIAMRVLEKNKTRLIGPNCPGIISVDECKLGIMPGFICKKGTIGVVSKSGTLTYEAIGQLASVGLGQTTAVGIGGDPIIGTTMKEILELFEKDQETEGVVMIGEIGGQMENDAAKFYFDAAQRTSDASIRKLLGDLAIIESKHEDRAIKRARELDEKKSAIKELEKDKKQFLLTWVQPGLAGLMDGSVSTLAPIFATAFATMNSHTTLLVGLAASIGAGISMGFTEAVHDDGIISGRGSPVKRGFASGVMTTLGGLGHALPYLITDFYTATVLAILIVFFELWLIAWIQNKYMKISFSKAIFQVVFGGSLVLGAGILIGGV